MKERNESDGGERWVFLIALPLTDVFVARFGIFCARNNLNGIEFENPAVELGAFTK